MGIARTRGRQRLEAEALHVACAADIPGIGNDEATALMQRAERAAFVSNTHDFVLRRMGLHNASNMAAIATWVFSVRLTSTDRRERQVKRH
jgi:hypothetical protein